MKHALMINYITVITAASAGFTAEKPRMYFADTVSGRPFSKDPAVVRFKGSYWLYYSIPPYTGKAATGWTIGVARSDNIVDWTKAGELHNTGAAEKKGFTAPGAVVLGGKVHLFYQTYGNGRDDAICHAWSDDGLHFTRDPGNPVFRPRGDWTCGRAIDADVIAFKGRLLLYWATRDPEMKVQMQGVAAAPLDSDFSRGDWMQLNPDGPILAPGVPTNQDATDLDLAWEKRCIEAAAMAVRDGRLYMFYAGGYNNDPQQIGVAVSDDGINFTRLSDKPLLPNGPPGSWNASESGHPFLFQDEDGRDYLFYQGNNTNGKTWYLSVIPVEWKEGRPVLAPGTLPAGNGGRPAAIELSVDPSKTANRIDEKIYGHFLEHIYHSCDGGLWGEMVWNRSFEENDRGGWAVDGREVVQESLGANVRLVFGDRSWTDYEYTLEAKKIGGSEGFLVLFRAAGEKDFYWCNLGGWGNTRHSLERGRRGEGRWGTVGPSVAGRIETGRWYRIRVRCEDRRFRVWLDGKEVIDFTDDNKAHRAGAVGIGTWSTRARFRNMTVTALDGGVLYDDVPGEADRPMAGRHWTIAGTGGVFLDDQNPLNAGVSLRMETAGGTAAVRQAPLRINKGMEYHGSVWARGDRDGRLTVRLADGSGTIAESRVPRMREKWQRLRFTFQPKRGGADAYLEIAASGGGTAWIDQVSMMSAAALRADGFRPDLLAAVADLKPPVIRWPGGCFASAYLWKQGIGPQHERLPHPRDIWDQRDCYSFGTDEFIALCRRVGAEPLIVTNIGTPQWMGKGRLDEFLQESLDWLEYCNGPRDTKWGRVRARNGHPEPYGVKYWEIDNETWHMGAERYAAAAARVAAAMKKQDSSIVLAACGSGGFNLDWNRTVIERCAGLIDYISIHHYENPDNYAAGPRQYEDFFRKTGEIIAASKNPAMKIYVSEWNAQSTDWRTGLYCGGLLNAFERCGDILAIGGPALFLRHTSATGWDNAFINFDHAGWFPAPNYVVMKLWRDHYLPRRLDIAGETGVLNVVATAAADGRTICFKAVNPGADGRAVRLAIGGGFRPGRAAVRVVAPGDLRARNTLDNPRAVRPADGEAVIDGKAVSFTLPAFSAAVIEVRE